MGTPGKARSRHEERGRREMNDTRRGKERMGTLREEDGRNGKTDSMSAGEMPGRTVKTDGMSAGEMSEVRNYERRLTCCPSCGAWFQKARKQDHVLLTLPRFVPWLSIHSEPTAYIPGTLCQSQCSPAYSSEP